MQEGSNPKQLIAEKIKQSANILVTVSSNPSVDSLTAALGLTLMLNKLDKHATAVFSGVIPPAINFLEPGKTFENNVDSLRDFIIALDKEKADRLRYKVEDDVVRIFITPYRTKISEKDLQFSQGDFNVDLIVALGVEEQKDLDQAITAHGRILHDATVVTVNTTAQKSSLGSINWQEANASSLSEMLASLADQLKAGILDQQISTALLTGIVSSTERFSNQRTTPHVMTIAAQLMAAGANQQLIATKLQTIPAPVSPRREKPKQDTKPVDQPVSPQENQESSKANPDGEMHIEHNKSSEPSASANIPESTPKVEPKPESEPVPPQQAEPEESELPIAPPAAQNFDDLKQAIKEETVQAKPQREMTDEPPAPGNHNINDESPVAEPPKPEEESYLTTHPSWQGREIKPPTMGGTLSATAEQALEDKQREEVDEKRNHTILSHGDNGNKGSGNQKQRHKKSQSKPKQAPKPETAQNAPVPAAAPAPITEAQAIPEPPTQPVVPQESVATVSAPETVPAAAPAEAPQPPEVPLQSVSPPVSASAEQPQPEIPVAPPSLVVSEPLAPAAAANTSEAPPATEPSLPSIPEPTPTLAPAAKAPTLEELERQATSHAAESAAPQTISELEAERKQIQPAVGQSALPPAPQAQPLGQPAPAIPGLPPMPPMPDFSNLPPLPGTPGVTPGATPEAPQQATPEPQLPQLPPLPTEQPTQQMPTAPVQPQNPPSTSQPPAPADPKQFRIPGQP